MSTTDVQAAQREWEARVDALAPAEIFYAVFVDPSPLHRLLDGAALTPVSHEAQKRRLVEHAVSETLKRLGEVEIQFFLRSPDYDLNGPAHYEIRGRVSDRRVQVLGRGGVSHLAVVDELGTTIVFPASCVDEMVPAR